MPVDVLHTDPTPEEREKLAQQQTATADAFRLQMLQAGATVYGPDGYTVLKPRRPQPALVEATGAAPPEQVVEVDVPRATSQDDDVDRIFLDIDIDDVAEKILTLRRKHGDSIELRIPPPQTKVAFLIGRLQSRMAKLYERLVKATATQDVERVNKELLLIQEEIVRMAVPGLPQGLIATLGPRALSRVMDTVNQIVAEAMGDMDNPLSYVRRVYRQAGYPHGNDDKGLTRWLKDQLSDFENDEADVPNP